MVRIICSISRLEWIQAWHHLEDITLWGMKPWQRGTFGSGYFVVVVVVYSCLKLWSPKMDCQRKASIHWRYIKCALQKYVGWNLELKALKTFYVLNYFYNISFHVFLRNKLCKWKKIKNYRYPAVEPRTTAQLQRLLFQGSLKKHCHKIYKLAYWCCLIKLYTHIHSSTH